MIIFREPNYSGTRAVIGAPQVLTPASPTVYDASLNPLATLTLTADNTLGPITNALPGQSGTLWLIQDGTGGWVLTLDASQTDMLATQDQFVTMGPNEVAVIAWCTRDGINFEFFITVAA